MCNDVQCLFDTITGTNYVWKFKILHNLLSKFMLFSLLAVGVCSTTPWRLGNFHLLTKTVRCALKFWRKLHIELRLSCKMTISKVKNTFSYSSWCTKKRVLPCTMNKQHIVSLLVSDHSISKVIPTHTPHRLLILDNSA